MIEELKQLLTVVGNIPEMALHAFLAFGAYKLFMYLSTVAGIYGVVKLALNHMREVMMKRLEIREIEAKSPKEVTMTCDMFRLSREQFDQVSTALGAALNNPGYRYIDSSDLLNVTNAIYEVKRLKDEKQRERDARSFSRL